MKDEMTLTRRKAISMYKKGDSISSIIEKTGLSYTTIWRLVKASKVEVRAANAPLKFSDSDIDKLIALYNDKKNTIMDIMQQTGIKSQHTVYRLLKKSGINLRTKED